MTLWENIKKSLIEGLQSASDKTSEYTKIGRIKIDILGLKKEIEEKLVELGGRLYHLAAEDNRYDVKDEKEIIHLIEKIKKLEEELEKYDEELKRIKKDNGIDLD